MSENLYMLFLSIFILLLASNAPAIICAEIYYKKSTIKTELAIVCIILQLLSCFLVLKMNKYPLTIDLFIFILLVPFVVFGLTYLSKILLAKDYGNINSVVSGAVYIVYWFVDVIITLICFALYFGLITGV